MFVGLGQKQKPSSVTIYPKINTNGQSYKLSITDIIRTYPLKRKGERGYLKFGLLQNKSIDSGFEMNNHCNKDQNPIQNKTK